MENIELYYSSNGTLMHGEHDGRRYLPPSEISQIIFDKIQDSNLPSKLSDPQMIEDTIMTFSEGWLKAIQEMLSSKNVFFTARGDSYQYNLRENKINKDTLRMQMLSGVITEGQYKAKLEEKESLNEHYIAGGIVGVGAINNPFEGRKKESYEDAFEYFLNKKYSLKEEEEKEVEEGKEVEEPSLYEGELNENVGSSIEKMIDGAKFEFSEKGNDEIIELANYILTPEGAKNVAMSLKNRLKGEGGENYFTSKPEELDALLSKLREDKKPGTFKERSAMAKKARAGKDIGEKGKNFEKIAKSAAKKYGSEEAGKKVAGAVMYGKLNK